MSENLKGNGERILFVEDENGICEFVAMVLNRNNFVVFIANNFEEAISIYKREQGEFDLIFTDSALPDKSGLELVKQLLLYDPKLKILISSGSYDKEFQDKLHEGQGYPFLPKPYEINDLIMTIKKVIDK